MPLNLNSIDYLDLINWNGCRVTVPPILSDLSEEQLKSVVSGHSPPVTELESFPFDTQSVEKCVKIVTEAAAVCGADNRDSFIRARLQSRELIEAHI